MKTVIVTGGSINPNVLHNYINDPTTKLIIAVDKGTEVFASEFIKPHFVVGDFDSISLNVFNKIASWGSEIVQFPSEKDWTDTEIALKLAIEKGATEINIIGGTGTRIDHVLGNIQLLEIAVNANIPCYMVDEYNRIRLVTGSVIIKKEEQYGRFISVIPLRGDLKGVTIKGAKYELVNAEIKCGTSLGISNEIKGDVMLINISEGEAVVVESLD